MSQKGLSLPELKKPSNFFPCQARDSSAAQSQMSLWRNQRGSPARRALGAESPLQPQPQNKRSCWKQPSQDSPFWLLPAAAGSIPVSFTSPLRRQAGSQGTVSPTTPRSPHTATKPPPPSLRSPGSGAQTCSQVGLVGGARWLIRTKTKMGSGHTLRAT